jgi:hypothetical protein
VFGCFSGGFPIIAVSGMAIALTLENRWSNVPPGAGGSGALLQILRFPANNHSSFPLMLGNIFLG